MNRSTNIKGGIYRVVFTEPPIINDHRTDFFFSSLAAIYDVFTTEQIGCGAPRLYNLKMPSGKAYIGRRCSITREPLIGKMRNSPSNSLKK